MFRSFRFLTMSTFLGLGACLGHGTIDGVVEPDAGADAFTPLAVTVVSPAPGESIARSYLTGDGSWVARVTFRAEADGAASVDWMAGGLVQGIGLPPDYAFHAQIAADGPQSFVAVARGQDGEERGRANVSFTVSGAPGATSCLDTLSALGVDFVDGSGVGIPTPVKVGLPLNGIRYHSGSLATAPRTTWLMDCELAVALWKMGDVFQKAGITDVVDYGIYNYRCIDQTVDPPACPGSKLSMHAYAQAIDVAGVQTASGMWHSVNDDWVIDVVATGKNACTVAPVADPKNEYLHTIVCDLYAKHVYNIILTPNYNAAHRSHFHMDLTDDTWVIHKAEPGGVDVGPDDP